MADYEYSFVRGGFDVDIVPSDQGEEFAFVVLSERGNKVFSDDISLENLVEIEDAGQAAIDLFEAERGTLGLGAGAKPSKMKGAAMKKKSCLGVGPYENLYLEVRGTMFEERTLSLIQQWIQLDKESYSVDEDIAILYSKQQSLRQEMVDLDLERLINLPPEVKVIVIQADKKAQFGNYEIEEIKTYLAKFSGDKLEYKAIQKCKDYVDVLQQMDNLQSESNEKWDEKILVQEELDKIELEAFQISLDESIPEELQETPNKLTEGILDLVEGIPEALEMEEDLPEPLSLMQDEMYF